MGNGISIIMPCYHNSDMTRDCLDSIKKYTRMPYEMILIDDHSQDDCRTMDVLSEFDSGMPKIVVRNWVNSGGCSRIWNQGIKLATKGYILIMNNDMVVTDNWLSKMMSTFDMDPTIAVVCPSLASHDADGAHWIMEEPFFIDTFNEVAHEKSRGNEYKYDNSAMGTCFLFDRRLLDEVGIFDEKFGLGGYEEVDWLERVKSKGYRLATRRDVWLYHYKRQGLMKIPNRAELQTADFAYFNRKQALRKQFGKFVNDDEVKRIANEPIQ